jgi:hypothetical protein
MAGCALSFANPENVFVRRWRVTSNPEVEVGEARLAGFGSSEVSSHGAEIWRHCHGVFTPVSGQEPELLKEAHPKPGTSAN